SNSPLALSRSEPRPGPPGCGVVLLPWGREPGAWPLTDVIAPARVRGRAVAHVRGRGGGGPRGPAGGVGFPARVVLGGGGNPVGDGVGVALKPLVGVAAGRGEPG